jgi:hypothetical protein
MVGPAGHPSLTDMRLLRSILLSLLGPAATACGTNTYVVASWKDPAVQQIAFRKVVAVAPNRDPAIRRAMEDQLVDEISPTAQAVPSYTLFSDADIGNEAAVRQRVRDLGFDGAVVMRVVAVSKEHTWVPGMYSGAYYAYGGWPLYGYGGWPMYDPGYLRTDTVVRVQTSVYSLRDDRIVWASTSKTIDPGNVRKLVDKVARAVGKEMKKQGLIVDGD